MEAYVLIKTSGGTALGLLETIRAIGGVTEARGVYGSVDIVAKLEAENLAELVVDRIRKLDGVTDTNTLIVAA